MRVILDLTPISDVLKESTEDLYLTVVSTSGDTKKYLLRAVNTVADTVASTSFIYYKNIPILKHDDTILVGGETTPTPLASTSTKRKNNNKYQMIGNVKIYGYVVTNVDLETKGDLLLELKKESNNVYHLLSEIDMTYLNKTPSNCNNTNEIQFTDNFIVFGSLFIIVAILLIILGIAQFRQKESFYV